MRRAREADGDVAVDTVDECPNSGNSAEGDAFDQEIRLAVVLNGGVSLAVWMSGVTLELHHLAMARRWQQSVYEPLLGLVQADARVDVIAGTSAGGINGAFLALGLARNRDLRGLRDLWRDHGSLERLLRSPLDKDPPSLLQGEGYFLPKLEQALGRILDAKPPTPADQGAADSDGHPVELILTGTLWEGRTTSFTDDLGVGITEVDHDATFRFAKPVAGRPALGDLAVDGVDGVVEKLASAARCTSSFPGAFEPHWVDVDASTTAGDGPWPSSAGGANFRQSQYVLDGGVLLNKPIRPALEAVYRQPAEIQVRRVLAYVVPDPGETTTLPGKENRPQARDAVLGVFTRLRSTDSVSRELAEIRDNNEAVRLRRRVRDRLGAAMAGATGDLSKRAWSGYIEVRIDLAARIIAGLIAAGQPAQWDRWSRSELADVLRRLLWRSRGQAASFIPAGPLDRALNRTGSEWDWGVTTVERLADIAVDVLRRAVLLAPMNTDQRRAVIAARHRLTFALEDIRRERRRLDDYWAGAPASKMPSRKAKPGSGTATNMDELEKWLDETLEGWMRHEDRQWQYERARAMAGALCACASDIAAVARIQWPAESDRQASERLRALHDYLFGPARRPAGAARVPWRGLPSEHEVLRRMLRLDVVQLSFSGASQAVEQEVELVQFSAKDPHLLTGRQLHHFGAFYRPSWRVNDWLRGRMDGAEHIVRMLLSSDQLRQCAVVTADSGATSPERVAELLDAVRECALYTRSDGDDRSWLEAKWEEREAQCRTFLESIVTVVHLNTPRWRRWTRDSNRTGQPEAAVDPAGLQACIEVITQAAQTDILREDLDALAVSINGEPSRDRTRGESGWLNLYNTRKKDAVGGVLPTQALWDLWEETYQIGEELIAGDAGSDTFARTVSQAASVAVNTATAPEPNSAFDLHRIKLLGTVLAAFRGYTLTVWGMVTFLTRRSRFGTNTVELAIAAGGVLIACALFVPGLPAVFTLAGALLLLAGASASALLVRSAPPPPSRPDGKPSASTGKPSKDPASQSPAKGARRVGRRLAGVVVLLAAVLAYLIWEWVAHHSHESALSVLIRIGVGVFIVLVGWWVAGAQRRPSEPDSETGTAPTGRRDRQR
ncbi:patatin-like protein [Kitasatospora sp. NPDC059648]|uniref:patatin-like protein n=1 Tax=Kitasatospora sp. NPDC059648 TaxID=3346894 RepID=UPI0036AB89DA